MSTAHPAPTDPERDIPLTEIPKTIRELRESWAREYSRANRLDRLLERAHQSASDWQGIALQNGEDLARARVELAKLNPEHMHALVDELVELRNKHGRTLLELDAANGAAGSLGAENDRMCDEIARLRLKLKKANERANVLAEFAAHTIEFEGADTSHPHVRELVEAAGVDCRECHGEGKYIDELEETVTDCDACMTIGKVLR